MWPPATPTGLAAVSMCLVEAGGDADVLIVVLDAEREDAEPVDLALAAQEV